MIRLALSFALLAASSLAQPAALAPAACAVRHTLWVEHFAAQLYVPQEEGAAAVRDPHAPKLLRLRILNASLMPTHIPQRWRAALQGVLDESTMQRLASAYSGLKTGDEVTVHYEPASGLELRINEHSVAHASGHEAIDALLRAWARNEPAGEKLARAVRRHPCG